MSTTYTVPIVPTVPPPPKRGGWKSKLGGIMKALGGVVLGFFLENILPQLLGGANPLPTGAVTMGVSSLIVGDALQRYGLADKQERTIEAVEQNTAAVKADTISSAPRMR